MGGVHPPAPTRRAALLTVGAALLTATGCGVRLEEDAPNLPFVPTRQPVDGEAALLTVLAATTHQQDAGAGERADLLAEALAELRVPEASITAARRRPTPTVGEDIAAHEAALRTCPSPLLPQVGRLCVSRLRHGQRELWTADDDERTWVAAPAAAQAASATRAAIWGLTVAGAKGDERLRGEVEQDVELLDRLRTRQVSAGEDGGEDAPLGYQLDEQVGTAGEARALSGALLARLARSYLGLFAELADDRSAAHEVVSWTVDVLDRGADRDLSVPELHLDLG
ncbi:hypothetical protein GCM10022199_23830 [Marihabitans asiaticum]|uniref:DUF4439 domain-containing protein n=1 Tax=Marihabitans asiaticum TaxID=415218 RepID=A0A560W9U4_9MICO|nr:hypothetical protein [Marihabitans asiaticum]TWD14396.1 hypothetical protein FB557_1805 [Marihabitans asiaticum]